MISYSAFFNKLYLILPTFIEWMNQLLETNRSNAVSVIEFGFKKIDVVFPPNLRKSAKIVIIKDNLPLPPFKQMGFHELSELEQLNTIGITYKDFIFVMEEHLTEFTCFHEMIHVVQWKQLGVTKFLMAYGMGIALYGYADSPFEQIAYDYQKKLESNALPMNFLEETRRKTENAWTNMNPLIHLPSV